VRAGGSLHIPHWDALTAITRQASAKLFGAGDNAQHGAVQAGGGLGMFTGRLGSLQLGEALRFAHAWEREASLRLRAGDQAVIPVYDEQGRMLAGTKEEMTEEAYRSWPAHAVSAPHDEEHLTSGVTRALVSSQRTPGASHRYTKRKDPLPWADDSELASRWLRLPRLFSPAARRPGRGRRSHGRAW
jgi:AAA domain